MQTRPQGFWSNNINLIIELAKEQLNGLVATVRDGNKYNPNLEDNLGNFNGILKCFAFGFLF